MLLFKRVPSIHFFIAKKEAISKRQSENSTAKPKVVYFAKSAILSLKTFEILLKKSK